MQIPSMSYMANPAQPSLMVALTISFHPMATLIGAEIMLVPLLCGASPDMVSVLKSMPRCNDMRGTFWMSLSSNSIKWGLSTICHPNFLWKLTSDGKFYFFCMTNAEECIDLNDGKKEGGTHNTPSTGWSMTPQCWVTSDGCCCDHQWHGSSTSATQREACKQTLLHFQHHCQSSIILQVLLAMKVPTIVIKFISYSGSFMTQRLYMMQFFTPWMTSVSPTYTPSMAKRLFILLPGTMVGQ